MESSDNKLVEWALYSGGSWQKLLPGDAEYNGNMIRKHVLKVPLSFTYSILHDVVKSAVGSAPFHLTYKLPVHLAHDPEVTFYPITIGHERDLKAHFREHVRMQLASGKPVELYHDVHD